MSDAIHNAQEQAAEMYRQLTDAMNTACENPCPANLSDVSTWIKTCHQQMERIADLRDKETEAACSE